MSVWNNEYQNTSLNKKFDNWYSNICEISLYWGNWKISQILEPYSNANNESRIIEIQSSYIVQFKNINKATKVMQDELSQNILNGHCSKRIFGPDAQTLFTGSSFGIVFLHGRKAYLIDPTRNLLNLKFGLQNGQR